MGFSYTTPFEYFFIRDSYCPSREGMAKSFIIALMNYDNKFVLPALQSLGVFIPSPEGP